MSTQAQVTVYGASDVHFKRSIGCVGLIGLFVSIQIGSGWLFACLAAVSKAGPAAVVSWVLGTLFFAVIGIAWMELGVAIPRSGAGIRYPRMSHGPFLSWINSWGYMLAAITLPAIEVIATLSYIGGHWENLGLLEVRDGIKILSWPNGILSGIVLMAVFLLLNLFGAKLLSDSNKWVTIWKILIPIITAVLMLCAFKVENFTQYGGFAPMGVSSVFHALSSTGIIFAYLGVRQIVEFSGEVKNPRRDLPIALFVGGLLIPTVIYLGLQVGFIGAIDWADAGVEPGDWAGMLTSSWQASPLLSAVTAAGFAWFFLILLSDAALSPAAAGWVNLGLAGRAAYSMSIGGELPAKLQMINRWGVPWVALIVCSAASCVLFLPMPSWYLFVGVLSAAMVLNYFMVAPCMAVFCRVAPDLPRPLKTPFLKFWLVAGYVGSTLLLYFAQWSILINVMTALMFALPVFASHTAVRNGWVSRNVAGGFSLLWSLAWVLVTVKAGWAFVTTVRPDQWPIELYALAFNGLVLLFLAVLYAISTPAGRAQIRAGLWPFPVLLILTFMSYFGADGPQPVLNYAVELLIVLAIALGSYVWAVGSGYRTDELDQVVQQQLKQQAASSKQQAVITSQDNA